MSKTPDELFQEFIEAGKANGSVLMVKNVITGEMEAGAIMAIALGCQDCGQARLFDWVKMKKDENSFEYIQSKLPDCKLEIAGHFVHFVSGEKAVVPTPGLEDLLETAMQDNHQRFHVKEK